MTTPEEIQAFDEKQRKMFVEAVDSGEDLEEAMEKIKKSTRQEWINLINNYPNV